MSVLKIGVMAAIVLMLSGCIKDQKIWDTNGAYGDRTIWETNGKKTNTPDSIWKNSKGEDVLTSPAKE